MNPLQDVSAPRPVSSSRNVYHGMVWSIRRDTVQFADGVEFDRELMDHTGAVALLALDDAGRAIVINQYRHPVGEEMWELPAGLLDHPEEDPASAALRELTEETGYEADSAEPLAEFYPSPGGSDELIRVYLARGVRPAEQNAYERVHEEAEIKVRAVPMAELLEGVLQGRLRNGPLQIGVLTAQARGIS